MMKTFELRAECGEAAGMAYFAYCLFGGVRVKEDEELRAEKVLLSSNSFAVGLCQSVKQRFKL